MAILTLSSLKAYLGTTQTEDDDLMQNAIDSAQSKIENRCGCEFESTTGTRYYRSDDLLDLPVTGLTRSALSIYRASLGYGLDAGQTYLSNAYSRRVLYLGKHLLALGGLTNGDGTTIASTDCWLEPRNSPPYQYIRLKSAESWSFGTDGEITVSGTWGWSTSAPADIVEATRQLAAYYYRLKDSQVYDVVANPETGTITVPKGIPAGVERILKDGGYLKDFRIV